MGSDQIDGKVVMTINPGGLNERLLHYHHIAFVRQQNYYIFVVMIYFSPVLTRSIHLISMQYFVVASSIEGSLQKKDIY